MPRWFLLLLCLVAGCERARPLPAPARPRPDDRPTPVESGRIPPDWTWIEMGRDPFTKDVPIVFVHAEAHPEDWGRLATFWNLPDKGKGPVRVKVPLGLDDPTAYLPSANPPTLGKWELGRRLFFDDTWLTDRPGTSCATCHDPRQGFTDGKKQSGFGRNAPTLLNVVFARSLFWDGRATHLEEAVQRRPEDERESGLHAWAGVVTRLRRNKELRSRFLDVFGVTVSQDGIGQALATYMRTLLAGNSLYDRVRRVGKLDAGAFEKVLDEAGLARLERPGAKKAEIAGELARGWEVFTGPGACTTCHPSGNGYFSDSRFANIGIDADGEILGDRERMGRFAVAPLGEKSRTTLAAWKTPTLRSLIRTGPYFHTGEDRELRTAIRRHLQADPPGVPVNNYLDPRLAGPDGRRREFGLTERDVAALELFLRALDGESVDPILMAP